MNSSLIFLIVAFAGQIFAAPLDGSKGDCAGGLSNGALLERGHFFYECRNGELVPKGCITDELKHIEIGSTTDKKTFRLRCNLDGSNMNLEPIACLHQGSDHQIDSQWEDGTNFFTCKKEDNTLRTVNSGCIDQGKRVALNDKVVTETLVMLCNGTVNNGSRMMPAGCVKDGHQYNVGDSYEVDKYWFTCTRVGREKVVAKAAGCVNNGKRLNDGERFFEKDVIYECNVDNDKITVRATGCAQRDEKGTVIERRLGCTWVEGPEPFQYEIACQHDAAANSAKKVAVRCNYKVGGGVYNIEPGCYRLVEKSAFGCLTDASSGLKLQSFQGENAEQSAQSAGLHAC